MNMKRKKIISVFFAAILVYSSSIFAYGLSANAADSAKENAQVPVKVIQISDDVVKVVMTHYAKPQKPPGQDTSLGGYKLTGWHIANQIQYSLNVTGTNLDAEVCAGEMGKALIEWNSHLPDSASNLFSEDIEVGGWIGSTDSDDRNLIAFGTLGDRVIAVATTWFDTKTAEVLESDIVFNTYYSWGYGSDVEMDIQNITTHETGHVCGLSDLYVKKYSSMTMCGWVFGDGETYKSTLEDGDIAGLHAIYGQ